MTGYKLAYIRRICGRCGPLSPVTTCPGSSLPELTPLFLHSRSTPLSFLSSDGTRSPLLHLASFPSNAELFEFEDEAVLHVLRAAIRMMQQSRRRLSARHGVPPGREHEERGQGWGASPADHPPAERIEDRGYVQPSLRRFQIGDIGHPDLIGRRRPLKQWQQIRSHRLAMPAVRGTRLSPMFLPTTDAALVHEPGTAFFAGINPGCLEIAQDPRRPVIAPALRVEADDLVGQFRILLRSSARPRRQPPIISRPAHAQRLAKESYVIVRRSSP